VVFASNPAYTGANLRFFNNVFYTTGGTAFSDQTSTPGVVTFKNNLVYNTGTSSEHYGVRITTTGSMVHSNNAVYMPADAARITVNSGSSYYTRSTLLNWEPTAIASAPNMTNPSAYDFTLAAGSPAIDAGTSVGLIADYGGSPVPQGALPDVGAHEWK
jgi:hypothetical protein